MGDEEGRKRKVAPGKTFSEALGVYRRVRSWQSEHNFNLDTLARCKREHREYYGFKNVTPKGLNGVNSTTMATSKQQIVYSVCPSCRAYSYFLNPSGEGHIAVYDEEDKQIARRRGFQEVKFNLLTKGGIIPRLKVASQPKLLHEEPPPSTVTLANCKNNNSLPDLYIHKEEKSAAAIVHVTKKEFPQ
jgi:hypothetical protein